MNVFNPCPCNSGNAYSACCGPLIAGDQYAHTAEALMRSRYTAYVIKNVDYLLKTWHPSTRPLRLDSQTIPDWCGLQVIRSEAGAESDNRGVVEYEAKAIVRKKIHNLHEISRFVKENNQWLYVDGDILESPPVGRHKVGRNEPCPCGSGRKFKKCCGKNNA